MNAARRSGRDDDALGIDFAAIGLTVVPRDPRAQRRNAERRGVVDPRRDRARRAPRRSPSSARLGRLADLQMNDMTAGGLDPRRRGHHVHDHERRHVAARTTAQKAMDRSSRHGNPRNSRTCLCRSPHGRGSVAANLPAVMPRLVILPGDLRGPLSGELRRNRRDGKQPECADCDVSARLLSLRGRRAIRLAALAIAAALALSMRRGAGRRLGRSRRPADRPRRRDRAAAARLHRADPARRRARQAERPRRHHQRHPRSTPS